MISEITKSFFTSYCYFHFINKGNETGIWLSNYTYFLFYYTGGGLSGSLNSFILIKHFPNHDKDSVQICISKEQNWFDSYLKQDS